MAKVVGSDDDRLWVRCYVYNMGEGDVPLEDAQYLPLFPDGTIAQGRNEIRFWVDDKRLSALYSNFSRDYGSRFVCRMGSTYFAGAPS